MLKFIHAFWLDPYVQRKFTEFWLIQNSKRWKKTRQDEGVYASELHWALEGTRSYIVQFLLDWTQTFGINLY